MTNRPTIQEHLDAKKPEKTETRYVIWDFDFFDRRVA